MRLKPFFIRHNKMLRRIDPEKVVCFVTEKNHTKIYLSDETFFEVRVPLKTFLTRLPPGVFIQTHPAYAVSVYYMDYIEKESLTVFKNDGIPVSAKFYDHLNANIDIIE